MATEQKPPNVDQEFQQLVGRAEQRYQEQRQSRDQEIAQRGRRSEALQQHIAARCASAGSNVREGVRYERRRGGPEGARELDIHQLTWTATQPHRILQLAVDLKADKMYWTWTEEGLVTKDYAAEITDGSIDQVDDLIRLLADQDAWWTKTVPGYHSDS